MGGMIGVSIMTCVLNTFIRSHLSMILSPEQLQQVLVSVLTVDALPMELQNSVRLTMAR